MRMRWPLPEKPRKYRLPLPRWPASGQALFWQQKCSIGCWWAACIAQLLVHAGLVVLPLLSHSKHRCLPSSDTTQVFQRWDTLHPVFEHLAGRLALSVIDVGFDRTFDRVLPVYLKRRQRLQPLDHYEQEASGGGWMPAAIVGVRLRTPR